MTTLVKARGLTKRYGATVALDHVDFDIESGRIVGLIGPNGAGKTTALKALLGLTPFEGDLEVLGVDPRRDRPRLMREVCFIADVAVLPRWLTVARALEYVESVHPRFSREKAEAFLAKTEIRKDHKIKALSKGMVTQLHLALVMAIDVKLLVLDEPTLGLDILYRKSFYRALLEDYFDEERTILVTTHQVEEVEHILTDLMFIHRGKLALNASMEEVADTYVQVLATPDKADAARELKPIHEQQVFGKHMFLFEGIQRERLEPLGELRTPTVADLFVAKLEGAR